MEKSTTSSTNPKAADGVPGNGVAGTPSSATAADEARRKAMERAEELADRLGEQVGHYVSLFGHSVLKWVARAREEAEDIWAEAQALRERQRSANKEKN
jgi:hypothetical protein